MSALTVAVEATVADKQWAELAARKPEKALTIDLVWAGTQAAAVTAMILLDSYSAGGLLAEGARAAKRFASNTAEKMAAQADSAAVAARTPDDLASGGDGAHAADAEDMANVSGPT